MDTSSISSNKITLKISTPQGKEMALNKGEVLQAQVQEVGENGQVTIVVKGKAIEAFTEVAVKPGQQLLLMVDDLRHGKTYLKVVTPEMMGKIENTNIAANLVEMGIAAKEENIALARKLLQYNLPVTQNNLNELSRNISSLGGVNGRNLEIAAFALSRGITGKSALESLTQFLASPSDAAKLITVLERLANTLAGVNPDSEFEAAAAPAKNNTSLGNSSVNNAGSEGSFPSGSGRTIQSDKLLTLLPDEAASESKLNQAGSAKNSSAAPLTGNAGTAEESQTLMMKTNSQSANLSAASPNSQASSSTGGGDKNLASTEQAPAGNQTTEILTGSAKSEPSAAKAAPANLPPGSVLPEGEAPAPGSIKLVNGGVLAADETMAEQTAGNSQDKTAASVIKEENTAAQNSSSPAKPQAAQSGSGKDLIQQLTVLTNAEGKTASLNSPNLPGIQADEISLQNESGLQSKGDIAGGKEMQDAAVKTGEKAAPTSLGNQTANNVLLDEEQILTAQNLLSTEEEVLNRLLGSEDRIGLKSALASPPENESLKQDIIKLLDAVRSFMEIDLEAAPEKIAGKLQGSSNLDKEVIKALNLLVDMARNQDMITKIPELKEFSMSLDRLEKEISGQQLFNLSTRSVADNLSGYYYFAIPVKIDQEYSLCQLKINKDGRKNLKDADKLSFVVSLNTSKLGLVLFHITWQRIGTLQLQGVSQSQASCDFLNQHSAELVGSLEELGYKVKNLGVKVSSSAEELQMRPVLQEVGEKLRPLGIDVTV